MNFIKTNNTTLLDTFRKELYQKFSAPIDGMWENLYIASAQAYIIEDEMKQIGYCCINDDGYLNQLYLSDEHNMLMDGTVRSLIDRNMIRAASLSSIEPVSFNVCLSHSKSIHTNTYCFRYANGVERNNSELSLELAVDDDVSAIKSFFKEQIEFDDSFGYTENLIQRKELYLVRESDTVIATGECRLSDTQPNVADVGVVVNKEHRGKGIATQVLHQLAHEALKIKRTPICSTTYDNKASKKAIERAGFYCSHMIFDISFGNSN